MTTPEQRARMSPEELQLRLLRAENALNHLVQFAEGLRGVRDRAPEVVADDIDMLVKTGLPDTVACESQPKKVSVDPESRWAQCSLCLGYYESHMGLCPCKCLLCIRDGACKAHPRPESEPPRGDATATAPDTNDWDQIKSDPSKYTKRFMSMTADQLHGLLWLVGEFVARSSRDEFSPKGHVGGARRKYGALQEIGKYRVEHTPKGVDEVRQYIRECMLPNERDPKQERPEPEGVRVEEKWCAWLCQSRDCSSLGYLKFLLEGSCPDPEDNWVRAPWLDGSVWFRGPKS